MFRSDGLDNPMSPNSGSMTWDRVQQIADESGAVESYKFVGGQLEIEWCDGSKSLAANPTAAHNEIVAMSQS